jgi:serine/threonine protein phosphatase PrpC
MLDDDEIAAVLGREDDPDTAVAELVRLANENGGVDNVTALVVRVRSTDHAKAA